MAPPPSASNFRLALWESSREAGERASKGKIALQPYRLASQVTSPCTGEAKVRVALEGVDLLVNKRY